MRRYSTVHVILVALLLLGGIALSLPVTPVFAAPGGNGNAGGNGNGNGPPGDNDAASGGDAGNSPEQALVLGGNRRNWNANLTPPGTDADWYRLDASGTFCALLDATTNAPGQFTLGASTTLSESISRPADAHKARRLALAAPSGGAAFFGLEPPSTQSMRSAASGTSDDQGPGRYNFALEARSYAQLDPQGDGESPEAGATLATAAALPAECSAGRLASGDPADTYSFDLAEPREVGVSFAIASGSDAHLRVVSPTGVTVATLASGEATDVWADEIGEWSVVVEPIPSVALPSSLLLGTRAANGGAAATVDYILGITDGPGEPQPCRPTCLG